MHRNKHCSASGLSAGSSSDDIRLLQGSGLDFPLPMLDDETNFPVQMLSDLHVRAALMPIDVVNNQILGFQVEFWNVVSNTTK